VPDDSRMKTDFAVHLDGNKLQGEEAGAILGIRVFQTRSGASAFEIIVSDPELKWQGKPTFTDCKEVKIELGPTGKLKKVFDGEVTAWRTELERSGPTVLVLRGLDRSHRMMRAKKTKTYANASPIDCANQIAAQYGLTARTRPGAPPPVTTFRFQANQSDYEFLRSMADLEGYMFWIEGTDLHFERPRIPSNDDAEFTFGEDVKTFLPVANFRKPAVSVEVGAWDVTGKAELTGTAQTGDELWSVPGVKPGANLAKFTSTKREISLVESQVATQEHADTVAKAALTKRAMEFITAEVEVEGDPKVKPGALVNIKKVGPYSGHYLVTEANHFYDAAGYNCIFYIARDKWGNPAQAQQQAAAARAQTPAAQGVQQKPGQGQQQQPASQSQQTTQAQGAGNAATAANEPLATTSIAALLDEAHFEFDKAFALPSAIPTWRAILQAMAKEPERPILVVGHTDKQGSDEYNLELSRERAEIVAAALEGDVETWLAHYHRAEQGKRWGDREDRLLLRALPYGSSPYLAADADNASSDQVAKAVRAFQGDAGVTVDGTAGDETRRALLKAYLGAAGGALPSSASIAVHACGERHPRSTVDAENRRVDVFLFDGEIRPAPPECTSSPHPGCKVYDAWVHGVSRRLTPTDEPARPRAGEATIQIVHAAAPDEPLAGVRVHVRFPDGSIREMKSDAQGYLHLGTVPSGEYKITALDPIQLVSVDNS
jgi:outer membrane protein OmpA-like peptidoglycan-associated protein/phage protein D